MLGIKVTGEINRYEVNELHFALTENERGTVVRLTCGVMSSVEISRYLRFWNLVAMSLRRWSTLSTWRPEISGRRETKTQRRGSCEIMCHFLHTSADRRISQWFRYEKMRSST